MKNFFVLIFVFLITFFPANSADNIYKLIAKENLKSMTNEASEENVGLCAAINEIDDKGFEAFVKSRLEYQIHPNASDCQRLIFSLLASHYDKDKKSELPVSQILDEKTWQDLNILCGPVSNPHLYLAAKVAQGRTVTAAGKAALFRKIIEPSFDCKTLESQQAITRELISNESFFNELDLRLKELLIPENILLSFWSPEDGFALLVEEDKIKLPFDGNINFLKQTSNWINKSPMTIESYYQLNSFFKTLGDLLALYAVIALPIYLASGNDITPQFIQDNFSISSDKFKEISIFSALGVVALSINHFQKFKKLAALLTGPIAIYNNANQAYYSFRDYNDIRCVHDCTHKKLTYLAQYLRNLKEISEFVSKNDVLKSRLPAVQNFNKILEELNNQSEEIQQLFRLLEKDTFRGQRPWFFYKGEIMVVYRLMLEYKDKFIDAMSAVGELDAQLTIAKLYKNFQNKRVTFCFPNYLNQDDLVGPVIDIYDFWNPLIDEEKVVPNSIKLGKQYNTPQNVIITGPNAGGKSTITKSLIISIIMAQSLGLAPAKSLSFTPFSKIITYLNITDDIAAGNSHFKAGVLRARDLIEIAKNLSINQFGLCALDEVFNGTTFKEGQAAAYTLINELGNNPRNVCITNTHFPLVPTLERVTGKFKNYQVSVTENSNGKIVYDFTLRPGISDQVVALKILREEGFTDKFVADAQAVLCAS